MKSNNYQLTDNRIEIVDFLRGLVIIDMMLVHYCDYINIFPSFNIAKIINYSDFAIDGFILLFGFMIGCRYYAEFIIDKKSVIKRLFHRVLQVIMIQYMMIITISLPLAVFIGKEFTRGEPADLFIAKSLLFLNQVGLLHILPTFIPLLLLSIPVLYLLKNGCDVILAIMSLILFAMGHIDPYLFSIGEKTIFPIILWQIIFVIGVLLGKKSHENSKIIPDNILPHLIIASIIFIMVAIVYHGHHLIPALATLRSDYNVRVSKFPLNYLGMLYYGSIVYFIYCFTILSWKRIASIKVMHLTIMLFGRHSLLVFVIHVYFAYAIVWTNYYVTQNISMPLAIIVLNFAAALIALKFIERKRSDQILSEKTVLSVQKGT